MKKLISNLAFLFISGAFFMFLSNCSKEKESSSAIVGSWNVSSVEYDAFIGSMTVEEYYLNVLGYTQEEADFALAEFNAMVESYLESSMIEFEADYWYWTNIGSPAGDEGEWTINESETLIILDKGTIWETPVTVHSLTSSTLNISFTMDDDIDLDNDMQTPDVTVTFDITMTLTK